MFIALSVSVPSSPIWVIIPMIIVFIVIILPSSKIQKNMSGLTKKSIKIDHTEIRIISKSGTIVENINLEDVDKIRVKEEYSIPQESFKGIKEEFKRNANTHYIQLEQNKELKRIDF